MLLDKMLLLTKCYPWEDFTMTKCYLDQILGTWYLTKVNMTKCYLDKMIIWQIALDKILLIQRNLLLSRIIPTVNYMNYWIEETGSLWPQLLIYRNITHYFGIARPYWILDFTFLVVVTSLVDSQKCYIPIYNRQTILFKDLL